MIIFSVIVAINYYTAVQNWDLLDNYFILWKG